MSHSKYHLTPFIKKCIEAPLIPQRSEQWFELRKSRITGSMADTLLGTNRFQTWDSVVAEKAGCPTEFKGNAATQHGIDNEDKAIRLYEQATGRSVFELGLTEHPTIDILAHSPDGISLKKKESSDKTEDIEPILLEIKCPYSREIKKGKVPNYYMGQLQLGLFVFDLKKAHFVQYKAEPYTLDITIIERDEQWLERNMPLFVKFWDEVSYWKEKGWQRHPYVQKTRRAEVFDNLGDIYQGVKQRRIEIEASIDQSKVSAM
jgi:putative phage-type endonuclease